jgi:hypothetical protein
MLMDALRICESLSDVALTHWYRCMNDMLKLVILLLTQLRSGEILYFVLRNVSVSR